MPLFCGSGLLSAELCAISSRERARIKSCCPSVHIPRRKLKCLFFDTGSVRGFHEKWEGQWGELPNSGAIWKVRDKNRVEEPGAPPKFISAPDTDRIQAPGFNLDDPASFSCKYTPNPLRLILDWISELITTRDHGAY